MFFFGLIHIFIVCEVMANPKPSTWEMAVSSAATDDVFGGVKFCALCSHMVSKVGSGIKVFHILRIYFLLNLLFMSRVIEHRKIFIRCV